MSTICVIGIIVAYFIIGFITAIVLHDSSEFESGDEYDAVFCTFAWPIFWIVGVFMIITWPLSKLYKTIFSR
jgi:membrane protease YdiL (CAAX protease family)